VVYFNAQAIAHITPTIMAQTANWDMASGQEVTAIISIIMVF